MVSGSSPRFSSVVMYSSHKAARFQEPGPPQLIAAISDTFKGGEGGKAMLRVWAVGASFLASLYLLATQPDWPHTRVRRGTAVQS